MATESTDYSSWRGYGWLDADGPLESGKWPGDKQDTWESRSKLNVVTRRGPDDLARSYATGPATLALDLEPGKEDDMNKYRDRATRGAIGGPWRVMMRCVIRSLT